MASGYIERSAVLAERTTMIEYDEGGWGAKVEVVRVKDIETIPSADVAPVVRGSWIEKEKHNECSKCGFWTWFIKYDYCPGCGAKMRE